MFESRYFQFFLFAFGLLSGGADAIPRARGDRLELPAPAPFIHQLNGDAGCASTRWQRSGKSLGRWSSAAAMKRLGCDWRDKALIEILTGTTTSWALALSHESAAFSGQISE